MNHEHEWDFDQTLADTELVLSSAAWVTCAFFFSETTLTPWVFLVVLGSSCAVEKMTSRPSVVYTTTCASASKVIAAFKGLLSEKAPVKRRRFVFVS